MTVPDDPDRIPTQAELDAEDMAEIARQSKDADLRDRYPGRPVDPGPPPTALVRDARIVWALSAVAGLIWVVYGFVHLSEITDRLAARLEPGLADVPDIDPAAEAESMAGFWPWAFLIGLPIAVAVTWPLLVGVARWHSRNVRNVYLSAVVVIVLFIPVCADLLFNYPDSPRWVWALAWVQFGLLILSALVVMRRVVSAWLPPSMRVKPFRMVRGE